MGTWTVYTYNLYCISRERVNQPKDGNGVRLAPDICAPLRILINNSVSPFIQGHGAPGLFDFLVIFLAENAGSKVKCTHALMSIIFDDHWGGSWGGSTPMLGLGF